LGVIALLLWKKSHEHFESNNTQTITEEPSVDDILSSLDINLDDYLGKEGEIEFSDLPLDILNETQMNQILKALDKEFTRPDYSVDRVETGEEDDKDFNVFKLDVADNERFKKSIVQKSNEPVGEKLNTVKLDIFKAKLLRDEILKRKVILQNRDKLQKLKDKNRMLEKYSRDEIPSVVSKCFIEEHPYNIGGEFDKYNLEFTRHPVKWYGLQSKFTNVFPRDFAFV
jgi:hypothetical protein